ncbi:putative basic proline-rich protein-like [Iris pallida]|uniref:Basic proline-rich protein-like n=1 Tax=Iris pallida TaxID=29817 RepID=A0AAX6H2J0_IRIPA|nr:putative basic proline-rich protein-like [Iris pallida]
MKEEMAFSPSKSSSPPPPLRRRRTRSTASSSSSSSNSSLLSTPSPSQTPFHPSSSAVPFSWEHLPGIPKVPPANHHKTLTLIPPPSRSRTFPSRTHRRSDPKLVSAADVDPFAAALAECSKDSPAEPDFWRISRPVGSGPDRRRWSIADRLGFLDLYGSCKASCSVSQPGYRVLNRRS